MADESTTEWEDRRKRSVGKSKLDEYDYRAKFRLNKKTHRLVVPKSEENETHVTVYIEPIDWPKEK